MLLLLKAALVCQPVLLMTADAIVILWHSKTPRLADLVSRLEAEASSKLGGLEFGPFSALSAPPADPKLPTGRRPR